MILAATSNVQMLLLSPLGEVADRHYLRFFLAQCAAAQFLVSSANSVPFLAQVPLGQVPPRADCLIVCDWDCELSTVSAKAAIDSNTARTNCLKGSSH